MRTDKYRHFKSNSKDMTDWGHDSWVCSVGLLTSVRTLVAVGVGSYRTVCAATWWLLDSLPVWTTLKDSVLGSQKTSWNCIRRTSQLMITDTKQTHGGNNAYTVPRANVQLALLLQKVKQIHWLSHRPKDSITIRLTACCHTQKFSGTRQTLGSSINREFGRTI